MVRHDHRHARPNPTGGTSITRTLGLVALVVYIATIWLANYLVQHVGLVSVGFGLVAPAGVYCAGAALILRNIVQRTLGRSVSVFAIIVGAALSYWISPALATASAAAFLFSETADFLVYTPLARNGWVVSAFCGGVVGAAIDSAIFLQLAFHDLTFWRGQFVGKMEMVVLAIAAWALLEWWYGRPIQRAAT
jgi:uncharacterized PurR-regulated membrane protein YhhQ (DUF165 family)